MCLHEEKRTCRIPCLTLVVLFCALFLSGCEKETKTPMETNPSRLVNASDSLSFPSTASQPIAPPDSTSVLIDNVQKEYLAAYEKYVKTLRENGPQTIETLHALADYQKKYRMYQMMLQSQRKP